MENRLLYLLLITGILLRLAVAPAQRPENNDKHFAVVEYIATTHELPPSDAVEQAYHPPLFYLLAVPFASSPRTVQMLCVALSCVNLWLLYVLIRDSTILVTGVSKLYAMAFAAFLPQFILFGNYVSNDCLTFLLGSLAVLVGLRYSSVIIGCVLGLGLLTKATFLALIPVVAGAVWLVRRHLRPVAITLMLGLMLGCWKYVDNGRRYGRPFVSALDFGYGWVDVQKEQSDIAGSLASLSSANLMRYPYSMDTRHNSYLLALYATFYFPYIPQDGLMGGGKTPVRWLPQLTYLSALIPTFLALAGAWTLLRRWREPEVWWILAAPMALLLLVTVVGVKTQVWSVFQGRQLFAAMFGICATIGIAAARWPRAAGAGMGLFWLVSLAGLGVDFVRRLSMWLG